MLNVDSLTKTAPAPSWELSYNRSVIVRSVHQCPILHCPPLPRFSLRPPMPSRAISVNPFDAWNVALRYKDECEKASHP